MSIGIGRGHFLTMQQTAEANLLASVTRKPCQGIVSLWQCIYVINVLKTPLNWGLFPVNATHGDGDIVGNVKEAFNVMTQCRINDCPDSGL